MAKMPLSDAPCGIALRLEGFGQCDFIGWNSTGGVWKEHSAAVAAHAVSDGQPAGQQCRSAGSTDWSGGVELREPHSFGSHAVQMRSSDGRVPETSQITIAQIVGKDEHDVRWRIFGRPNRAGLTRESCK